MDCDICGKKAKVHLTQLVGGQIKKITLCDDCAKEKGVTDPTGFALAEMLLGKTPGKVVPAAPAVAGSGRRCPSCGFTLEDLRRIRRFGCAECYTTFRDDVNQMLRGMLEKKDLDKIVDLEIDKLVKRLREKDITIQLEASARDLLVKKGYDPSYGARPMRRAVERYLEDPLAEALLRGDVKPGDTAKVICPEGKEELVFETIGTKAEPDNAGV